MKKGIGVFFYLFILCLSLSNLVLVLMDSTAFQKRAANSQEEPEPSPTTHEGIKWILPEAQLRLIQICKGFLPEEFGFEEPHPKLIIFLNSTRYSPSIVTAKLKNLSHRSSSFNELSTTGALDATVETATLNRYYAEHGTLGQLQAVDRENETRRLDNLLEEAAYLCTAHVTDALQREIEMENLKDQLARQASSYIAIEWPIENKDAALEIFYEINKHVYRTELAVDLRVL